MPTELEIFVLSYNRPDFLRKCLQSIFGQTITDFTVTVLDNASTKDVQGTVTSFRDRRLSLVVNPKNLGPLGNFRKAKEMVAGRYSVIFHDDDTMSPCMLETQVNIFKKHPELSFITTNLNLTFEDDRMMIFPAPGAIDYELVADPGKLLTAFFSDRVFGFGSIMYNSHIARSVLCREEEFGNVFDGPYMLALAAAGPSAYVRNALYNARQHSTQDSAQRCWSYQYDIRRQKRFLDVSREYRIENLERRILAGVIEAYVVRRPLPSFWDWLRCVRQHQLLHAGLFAATLPYLFLRNLMVRAVRRNLPETYRRFLHYRLSKKKDRYY